MTAPGAPPLRVSPPLGGVVHLLLAGVLAAGGAAGALADRCGTLDDGDDRNAVALVVGAASVASISVVTGLWWARRRPFDGEPDPRSERFRIGAALAAGLGAGFYGGVYAGWINVSLAALGVAMVPVAAMACVGGGLRSLGRAAALHVGIQLGAYAGLAAVGHASWFGDVGPSNAELALTSTLPALVVWTLARLAFRRLRRPDRPGPGTPPRRAR